jgi:hypothetical protein
MFSRQGTFQRHLLRALGLIDWAFNKRQEEYESYSDWASCPSASRLGCWAAFRTALAWRDRSMPSLDCEMLDEVSWPAWEHPVAIWTGPLLSSQHSSPAGLSPSSMTGLDFWIRPLNSKYWQLCASLTFCHSCKVHNSQYFEFKGLIQPFSSKLP